MRATAAFLLMLVPTGTAYANPKTTAAPPRPLEPFAAPRIAGQAQVSNVRLVVDCNVLAHLDEKPIDCTFTTEMTVEAVSGEVRLSRAHSENEVAARERLAADGRPLSDEPRVLAAGERAEIRTSGSQRLFRYREQELFFSPAVARHVVFADQGIGGWWRIDTIRGTLFENGGDGLQRPRHMEVDIRGDAGAAVWVVAERFAESQTAPFPDTGRFSVEIPAEDRGISLVVGPFIGGGPRFDLSGDEDRGYLYAGAELAIHDFFFVSLALETDFESMMESVVGEFVFPFVLIYPGAGLGTVARQFGAAGVDVAIRLRASLGVLGIFTVLADFDIWAGGGATAAISLRLSI